MAIGQTGIFDPRDFNKSNMVSMSFTFGRFSIITGLSNNNVAASRGKAEFLEPEIETLPFSRQGPFIKNLSINYFLIFAT